MRDLKLAQPEEVQARTQTVMADAIVRAPGAV